MSIEVIGLERVNSMLLGNVETVLWIAGQCGYKLGVNVGTKVATKLSAITIHAPY